MKRSFENGGFQKTPLDFGYLESQVMFILIPRILFRALKKDKTITIVQLQV